MSDFSYLWADVCSNHHKEVTFLDVLNDCPMEHLVIKLIRGEATQDLSDAHNLEGDAIIVVRIVNSAYNATKFNIDVRKSSRSKVDFLHKKGEKKRGG